MDSTKFKGYTQPVFPGHEDFTKISVLNKCLY